MNPAIISALAALAGAAIGGLTSVFASWLAQQVQARAKLFAQDQTRRSELYKEFMDEAAKTYIDALQHDKADVPALVGLYAKISRMRALSSRRTVEGADQIAKKIIDAYMQPNKTFAELREMIDSGSIDFLRDFSEACRTEYEPRGPKRF
ncbi:MAG: hypothetical protein WBX25_03565 [Rhodomicrobium sp.]